jgi:hypothetical protein
MAQFSPREKVSDFSDISDKIDPAGKVASWRSCHLEPSGKGLQVNQTQVEFI